MTDGPCKRCGHSYEEHDNGDDCKHIDPTIAPHTPIGGFRCACTWFDTIGKPTPPEIPMYPSLGYRQCPKCLRNLWTIEWKSGGHEHCPYEEQHLHWECACGYHKVTKVYDSGR